MPNRRSQPRRFRLESQNEQRTRVAPGELIHTVLEDFCDFGQSVASAGAQGLVYPGRPLALKRVLPNLDENALKYGTTALVTLGSRPHQIAITMDDAGPGVPPALLPKLFPSFLKVEPPRHRCAAAEAGF